MSLTFKYYYGKESEQFNFIKIPKLLFSEEAFSGISNDAKILYALMLDRMSLSQQNEWFDAENRVFIIFTVEEAAEMMNCGSEKVTKLFKELDDINGIGLITRKRRGLGKPAIIYVRNFVVESGEVHNTDLEISEIENKENGKSDVLTSEKQISANLKTESTDFGKSKCNNTDINKTDINNTEYQSYQSIQSGQNDKEEVEKTIADNIEYDILTENNQSIVGLINEIKDIIVDVVTGERNVTLNGKTLSHESAKRAYMKLTYEHVLFVIDCLSKVSSEVKKLDKYLCTSLYNAVFTCNMATYTGFTAQTGHNLI